MGRIVTVNVVDLTRPIEQKGFKKVAMVDFTTADAGSVLTPQVVYDTKGLSEHPKLSKAASAFFANGGSSLLVSAKYVASANDIIPALEEMHEAYKFYGLTVIVDKANQESYLEKIKEFVEGNKCLAVVDIVGIASDVAGETIVNTIGNSDRIVAFAGIEDSNGNPIAAAVCGVCFPQDEGSITWGNKVVTGVQDSGYTLAEEVVVAAKNINYITVEKGLVITQFGRTTSGSNADITRSKDWLENRCAEALTSTLINNKKVSFTTQGMAMISSSLNQVGIQAVDMGMLDEFVVITPAVSSIPVNDKANRVLRGVRFIATLSGAVETIEMELQVKL